MITLSFSKSILEKLYENLLIAKKLGNIRLYQLAQALLWFAEDVGTQRNSGIRKGLKIFGAIELKGGSFQYLQSLAYELKPKSLKLLKDEQLPKELLELLKTLKGQKYATKQLFLTALSSLGDIRLTSDYQWVILQYTEVSGRFNGESYVEFLKQAVGVL
jgi:hypothetical protein